MEQLRYIRFYEGYEEMSTTQQTKKRALRNQINPVKFKSFLQMTNSKIIQLFDLEEFIGSGSESIVYKAVCKTNKTVVALKIIIKNSKKVFKEIDITKKLKHRNIINYISCDMDNNIELEYILMEYAELGNIRTFQEKILKKNILSESILCFMTYQILHGLNYCHINKIAHLDLKPQNIVIDKKLNFKIIDFSISLDYSLIISDTIQLPKNGTCFYIAPEIFSNTKISIKDINKVDLYSLGVILYNLAFGFYPYELNYDDNDYNKIYKKIKNNNLIINNKCKFSTYFIDFLKKLLEKKIKKRININEALNHYWIKGAKILLDEKEYLYNENSFLISLITDKCKDFNNYIYK